MTLDDECIARLKRGGWAEDLSVGDCEAAILAPRNTWSNLAYAIAGGAVIGYRPDAPGLVTGLALMALAFGSWMYHARKTIAANALDRAGMLMVGGCLMAAAIDPLRADLAVFVAALLVAVGIRLAPKMDISYPMMFVLVFCTGPGIFGAAPGLALASLGVFGLAYYAWHLDRAFKAGLWGHAIWHVLTAISLTLMYLALTAGGPYGG